MRINIQGTSMEVTEAISDYVTKKLGALDKFIDPEDESAVCDVEVGKTTNHHKGGDVFRAEINLKWSGRQYYTAVEKDDLYASIDEAKDQVIAELSKSKEKHDDSVREGGLEAKHILHEEPGEEEMESMI